MILLSGNGPASLLFGRSMDETVLPLVKLALNSDGCGYVSYVFLLDGYLLSSVHVGFLLCVMCSSNIWGKFPQSSV